MNMKRIKQRRTRSFKELQIHVLRTLNRNALGLVPLGQ